MDVPSLVRGEGVPAAGGESDVREVLAAEEVPRQPGVQFNRHLEFKARVRVQVKARVTALVKTILKCLLNCSPAQLAAVVAPLQPQLGLATSGHFGTLDRISPFLYFTTSRPDVQQIQRGKREGPLTAD